MKMYLVYHNNLWFDAATTLKDAIQTICERASRDGEYMVVLVEYGPKGQMPGIAHLIFRGVQAEARSLKWN